MCCENCRPGGKVSTDNFESQRKRTTIGYALLSLVALLVISCSVISRAQALIVSNPEAVFHLKYACFFGLLGLTARSWSFKKQGESPFPPYIFTYPCIVLGSCAAIAALPIEGHRYFFSAPVLAFIVGYLPMEAIEAIRKKL